MRAKKYLPYYGDDGRKSDEKSLDGMHSNEEGVATLVKSIEAHGIAYYSKSISNQCEMEAG